jgi:hypothetical protein
MAEYIFLDNEDRIVTIRDFNDPSEADELCKRLVNLQKVDIACYRFIFGRTPGPSRWHEFGRKLQNKIRKVVKR